jgi:hypothetical protein
MRVHGVVCVEGADAPRESDHRVEMRKLGYRGLVKLSIWESRWRLGLIEDVVCGARDKEGWEDAMKHPRRTRCE